MASKTIHAPKWRELRADGLPIISTWIDEAGVGQTNDWMDLWRRCIEEASRASVTIVYREPDEVLKGALVEVGAALASGKHVIAIGCDNETFVRHVRVLCSCSIEQAILVSQRVWEGGSNG